MSKRKLLVHWFLKYKYFGAAGSKIKKIWQDQIYSFICFVLGFFSLFIAA